MDVCFVWNNDLDVKYIMKYFVSHKDWIILTCFQSGFKLKYIYEVQKGRSTRI